MPTITVAKTKKGYEGSELIPAFQKCIRRDLEREGLFREVEPYDSGYREWYFMRVMSSKDIGLAEPHISSEIWGWLTHPCRRIQAPNVALDKHTERGRRLGRSFGHFFEEGTHRLQLSKEPYRALLRVLLRKAMALSSLAVLLQTQSFSP